MLESGQPTAASRYRGRLACKSRLSAIGPLASLRPDVALALSLAKRARELLLAAPGLVCLHVSEQGLRRRASRAPAVE